MKQIFYIIYLLRVAVIGMSNGNYIESLLHEGSNKFTASMFSEITKAKPEQSVILSAISVMPPLAELALAAVGESHDELLEAVGTSDDETTKAVFSYANKELQSSEPITVKTATKIYITKNSELNSAFAATTKDSFGSEVQNIDFGGKMNAAQEINDWVEEQTNHRIKDLVDPGSLDENTKAILVNAIYFKAAWEEPFYEQFTNEKEFHVNRNKVIQVPMMYNKKNYRYAESDELNSQIIEIPYEGYKASLVIVLPRDIEGIVELEKKLKVPNILDNILNQSSGTEVKLTIPKFRIETTTDLTSVLTKMNVTKLFEAGNAKLYNLLKNADDSLYIDSAIQKAFIEVDENGTEAAAANKFGIFTHSLIIHPEPPKVFIADRPFYFEIKMNSLTLFNGVMYGN